MTKFSVPHMTRGDSWVLSCLIYITIYSRTCCRIINTSSVVTFRGSKTMIDYAATKGAVIGFTRSLAQSLISKGIRVNAVAWGPSIHSFLRSHTDAYSNTVQVQSIHQFRLILEMPNRWKDGVAGLALDDQVSLVRLRQALSSWPVRTPLYTVSEQYPTSPNIPHSCYSG